MYSISDLFDKRFVVGSNLEQIMNGKEKTKASLCKEAGISRPTLDKLISGTITNKTNYEKHMGKILGCLSITPDIILGNSKNLFSRTKSIRKALSITSEFIASVTGISKERLEAIEAGQDASIAELRDIAFVLGTSVRCLKGENFFEQQIATLDIFCKTKSKDSDEELSGFWGHLGVLLNGRKEYNWFPITGSVRDLIYQTKDLERIIVPCMNNKVLVCNMKNIKNILLLDDACDPPNFTNWNSNVDEGANPLVLYEALEDYLSVDIEDEKTQELLSKNMLEVLDRFIRDNEYDEDDLYGLVNDSIIYFNDGHYHNVNFDFYYSLELADEIAFSYDFRDDHTYTKVITCCEMDGAEFLLNMDNVSMIELPLIDLENTICKSREELFGES